MRTVVVIAKKSPCTRHSVSHQFHQPATSWPERLTPCVVRLVGCHENPALQEARCAVPRNIHALPGIGRSAAASRETTASGLPCPGGHKSTAKPKNSSETAHNSKDKNHQIEERLNHKKSPKKMGVIFTPKTRLTGFFNGFKNHTYASITDIYPYSSSANSKNNSNYRREINRCLKRREIDGCRCGCRRSSCKSRTRS